jgi:ParB family chromosome partitioning protein
MGKRVNLAELANTEFYTPLTSAPNAHWPLDPDPPTRTVAISAVAQNPLNKRPPDDDELDGLADTIRHHGIIQPLVVCTARAYLTEFPDQHRAVGHAQWITLIGNRRLQAARRAGLTEVSIVINDDQITSLYEVMLIENGQRRELPPLLEAEAMAEVLKAAAISRRELARRIGKSHVYVAQRLALLNLIPELRAALEAGTLKIETARQLGELPEDEQEKIAATGQPYQMANRNGVGTRLPTKTIRVSSPAVAAESIRAKFTRDELTELVRLLTEQLARTSDPQ